MEEDGKIFNEKLPEEKSANIESPLKAISKTEFALKNKCTMDNQIPSNKEMDSLEREKLLLFRKSMDKKKRNSQDILNRIYKKNHTNEEYLDMFITNISRPSTFEKYKTNEKAINESSIINIKPEETNLRIKEGNVCVVPSMMKTKNNCNRRLFKCEYCNHRSSTQNYLRYHIITVHELKPQPMKPDPPNMINVNRKKALHKNKLRQNKSIENEFEIPICQIVCDEVKHSDSPSSHSILLEEKEEEYCSDPYRSTIYPRESLTAENIIKDHCEIIVDGDNKEYFDEDLDVGDSYQCSEDKDGNLIESENCEIDISASFHNKNVETEFQKRLQSIKTTNYSSKKSSLESSNVSAFELNNNNEKVQNDTIQLFKYDVCNENVEEGVNKAASKELFGSNLVPLPQMKSGLDGRKFEALKLKDGCSTGKRQYSLNMDPKKAYQMMHPSISRGFTCNKCNFSAGSRIRVRNHYLYVHLNTKLHTCEQCNRKYSRKEYLARHVLLKHYSSSLKYDCLSPECQFRTDSKGLFKDHVNLRHLDLKLFECIKCDKKYSFKHSLTDHNKKMHRYDPQTEPLELTKKTKPCVVNRKYSSIAPEEDLDEMMHRANTPGFICNKCSFTALTRSRVKSHYEFIHLDTKSFACTECDKYYTCKRSLDQHNKIHHSENKIIFSCQYTKKCKFRTYLSTSLTNHINRTHFKLKPFHCDECGGNYALKQTLNEHKRKFHIA